MVKIQDYEGKGNLRIYEWASRQPLKRVIQVADIKVFLPYPYSQDKKKLLLSNATLYMKADIFTRPDKSRSIMMTTQ